MTGRHQRTVEAIFATPTRGNIAWKDCEALLRALGGNVREGSGSRVRVTLSGVRATFHRPHPQKEARKAQVRSLRDFLREAGIEP